LETLDLNPFWQGGGDVQVASQMHNATQRPPRQCGSQAARTLPIRAAVSIHRDVEYPIAYIVACERRISFS